MTQHTPGPWTVERDGYTLTMRDQIVATGLAPDGAPAAEQRANVRLIATAPELLAALQRFAIVGGRTPATDGEYHITCEDILAARVAIAKAMGQEG